MKAFLLDFFGLSSCLKDDSVVDQVTTESSQRDDRRQAVAPHRRRPRERQSHTARSKRSLPQIDENSPLQRSNSSRHNGPAGSGSIGSCVRNKNNIIQRKPSSMSSTEDCRYQGRDDPAALGLSLSETMWHSHDEEDENDEFLDEQSAIRRSLKDQKQPQSIRRKNSSSSSSRRRKSSSRSSNNSQRSKLESFIDKQEEKKSLDDDADNVTTISKASINPYRLLNISQSSSPRDVYRGYRRKMKETEKDGGGERAFHDVGNAYRRIKAEIDRQERRRVEQSKRKTASNSNGNVEGGGGGGGGGGGSRRQIERSRSSKSSRQIGRRQRRKLSTSSSSSDDDDDDDDEESISSRATAIGARLKDHRELVKGLFANDNKDTDQKSSSNGPSTGVTSLENAVYSQSQMLTEMNVVPIDAGATNINEKKETITNSCFYLSLAASYLCGVGAFAIDPTVIYIKRSLVNDGSNQKTIEMDIASLPKKEKQLTKKLALQLKRAIEAAVCLVHPDWASSGMVGEEVQAFSDFLVYALDSDSVLGHWSIAVFDEASGFVDVYRGRHYGKIYPPTKVTNRNGREKLRYKDCDVAAKRANTLTLRYIPGHYQPLLPELTKMGNVRRKARKAGRAYDSGLHKRATLEEILHLLKKWNVSHVVTDGRA